jgi:glycosyltransferase involved in cell wall biosynthesis
MPAEPRNLAERRRRPTILYLVTEDWYFWSHRLALARASQAAGYRVIVATRVRDHGARIEEEGFELAPLPWRRRGDGPFGHFWAVLSIVRLYKRLRPDLVHHVAIKSVIFGGLAAWIAGLPAQVNAVAGLGYAFMRTSLKARLVGLPIRLAFGILVDRPGSVVIVQNADDATALTRRTGIRRERLALIPGSGVDTVRFQPAPEPAGPVVVAMVSRMLKDKGVLEFAEAARLLSATHPEIRFRLVGPLDPDNPTRLKEEAVRAFEQYGNLAWDGPTENVDAIWRDCHIAVLPSYREGLPKSLLEAAAAGRPIVATDVPGCRDIARDGENAILVPARAAADLAQAIAKLAADPALRRRLGTAGRALVEAKFGERHIIEATLAVYAELLEKVLARTDYVRTSTEA